MAIRVAEAGADERDPRAHRVEERLRGRRSAAVVGNLQQVDGRLPVTHAFRKQLWVDLLLHVAREQEAPRAEPDVQHHGNVVDRRAVVGRVQRNATRLWPQD
jgi:hypothetical protein